VSAHTTTFTSVQVETTALFKVSLDVITSLSHSAARVSVTSNSGLMTRKTQTAIEC
jgi:hypothetical protein